MATNKTKTKTTETIAQDSSENYEHLDAIMDAATNRLNKVKFEKEVKENLGKVPMNEICKMLGVDSEVINYIMTRRMGYLNTIDNGKSAYFTFHQFGQIAYAILKEKGDLI
jgi:hypothetical protein